MLSLWTDTSKKGRKNLLYVGNPLDNLKNIINFEIYKKNKTFVYAFWGIW